MTSAQDPHIQAYDPELMNPLHSIEDWQARANYWRERYIGSINQAGRLQSAHATHAAALKKLNELQAGKIECLVTMCDRLKIRRDFYAWLAAYALLAALILGVASLGGAA